MTPLWNRHRLERASHPAHAERAVTGSGLLVRSQELRAVAEVRRMVPGIDEADGLRLLGAITWQADTP